MGAQKQIEREIFPRSSSTCLVQGVVTREEGECKHSSSTGVISAVSSKQGLLHSG